MPTSADDMEEAYQTTLLLINMEIIQYTLSLIQDAGMEVENLRDFMKGYYVNYFVTTLRNIHILHENPPIDDHIMFQEYLKKICSSEKLKDHLDQLL